MSSSYRDFLAGKHLRVSPTGFDVTDAEINQRLFPWQRDIVRWAVRRGRAALWEECGLGKTPQQLEWARLVYRHTGGRVLILTPLAVAKQTLREAAKFSIDCPIRIAADQSEVSAGISVTNYERLHLFDASAFSGVVLDESSILKAYTGATKRQLCDAFAKTPYRLCCTATPAPNDRLELGNHSEFLGIMPSNEMIARWFINDAMRAGGYKLRTYAANDFWRWVCSWAVCISSPADLGHDANGFHLPPLRVTEHIVEKQSAGNGVLFDPGHNVSATDVHREKRSCLTERAAVVADLVNGNDDAWAVWCDTDYEADSLCDVIPDAVEVRGSQPQSVKEERLDAFTLGKSRVIVTKSEIAGFGLNWQHCHKTTWFAGYSYERWYQAVRRLWRFGQTKPVECHIVMSANEESIKRVLAQKEKAHGEIQREMASLMRDGMMEELYQHKVLTNYRAATASILPGWLATKGA